MHALYVLILFLLELVWTTGVTISDWTTANLSKVRTKFKKSDIWLTGSKTNNTNPFYIGCQTILRNGIVLQAKEGRKEVVVCLGEFFLTCKKWLVGDEKMSFVFRGTFSDPKLWPGKQQQLCIHIPACFFPFPFLSLVFLFVLEISTLAVPSERMSHIEANWRIKSEDKHWILDQLKTVK